MLKIRSGIGYDIHRIEKGNGLFIGGIPISTELKFVAHSDGDLLIHALIDSLLGAAGENDIGELFPDTDVQYKNIKSTLLLQKTLEILKNKNFEIINIDAVIIAESPKISPFKEQIKSNIATLLGIPAEDFNMKAKTKEKTGAVGRGEAMECFCVSMIRKRG
jgi:2-C-methyl-D-erythritol 2,4-cyclodiphosphate synthase